MNKKNITTIVLVLMVILLLVSVSVIKFKTINLIKTSSSVFKILSGQEIVVQVRENPNIYLSSPNDSMKLLKEFMEKKDYKYLPDERMASTLVFKGKDRKVYVEYSLNRYYGMWEFVKE